MHGLEKYLTEEPNTREENAQSIIRLFNTDNMDFMRSVPDGFYDLCISDPPYGIGVNQMNMGGRKTIKPNSKNWDDCVPDKHFFDELFRISKNQIIWGGNYFDLQPSQYFSIWDKGETMYGRDFAEAEYAWVRSGGTRIFKHTPNQLDRIHVTQKPVALYKWLLKNYAKEGDKIFDSHSGSLSIAIACGEMGFDLDACELDGDYFKESVARVQRHFTQSNAFMKTPEILVNP